MFHIRHYPRITGKVRLAMYNPMNDDGTRMNRQLILRKPGRELLVATWRDGFSEVEINNSVERPISYMLKLFLTNVNPAEVEIVITGGEEIRKHLEPEGHNLREVADLLVLRGMLDSVEAVLNNPSRPDCFREAHVAGAMECIRDVRDAAIVSINKTLENKCR